MAAVLAELRGEQGGKWSYEMAAPVWLLSFFNPELGAMVNWFHTTGTRDEVVQSRAMFPEIKTFKAYCIKMGYDKKDFPAPPSSCTVM
jgi:hypothetical protein